MLLFAFRDRWWALLHKQDFNFPEIVSCWGWIVKQLKPLQAHWNISTSQELQSVILKITASMEQQKLIGVISPLWKHGKHTLVLPDNELYSIRQAIQARTKDWAVSSISNLGNYLL